MQGTESPNMMTNRILASINDFEDTSQTTSVETTVSSVEHTIPALHSTKGSGQMWWSLWTGYGRADGIRSTRVYPIDDPSKGCAMALTGLTTIIPCLQKPFYYYFFSGHHPHEDVPLAPSYCGGTAAVIDWGLPRGNLSCLHRSRRHAMVIPRGVGATLSMCVCIVVENFEC